MSSLEESNNSYWLPNELPEPTKEWKEQQARKYYLTPEGEIKKHPGWFYGNESLVDDDYLFYNEGWKLIVDNPPEQLENKIIVECLPEEWDTVEKKAIKKYKIYSLEKTEKPKDTFETTFSLDYDYNDKDLTAKEVWNTNNLTEEEISKKEQEYFDTLRIRRNNLLEKSDVYVVRSVENKVSLTQEFKDYRQSLRDITETINIREIDFSTIFPEVPENIYE